MVTARGDNEGIGRIAAAEGETALLVALGAEGEEDAVVRGVELGAEGDGEGLGIGGQRRLHITPRMDGATVPRREGNGLAPILAGDGDVVRLATTQREITGTLVNAPVAGEIVSVSQAICRERRLGSPGDCGGEGRHHKEESPKHIVSFLHETKAGGVEIISQNGISLTLTLPPPNAS